MAETYCVVLSGRLREGETHDAVRVRLAELFRVRPEQLEPLFAKAPSVIRRGLDEITATKWVTAVEKTGALCWAELERPETVPAAKPVRSPVAPPVEPAREPAAPVSLAPNVVPLAVPVKPAVSKRTEGEVVPFPKCPKCGRLPDSLEDPFMRTGVCPQCGLIIRKYATNYAVSEEGFWDRFGAMKGSDRHWAAFWQSRLWPSYWRGAWYLCCALLPVPGILHVLNVRKEEAVTPTIVEMGVSGITVAVLGLLVAIAGFYCFAVFRNSQRVFLVHVLCSLGVCGILAVPAALLSFLSEGVAAIGRFLRAGVLMNPVRALGFAVMAFFAIVLYFGFVRLPAEKQLWEYLDGPQYSATVKEARALAGPDFPKGSRADKYRYFRYVLVEPTRTVDPEFERVLSRLLPDFSPHSFGQQHGPEVNLLVFNAIAFRDELANDNLISPHMRLRLEGIAADWEQSRKKSPTRLVRSFDDRSPVDRIDLHYLPDRN